MFFATFMCLQLGLVVFWRKDIGAKAARKRLVKVTIRGMDRNENNCNPFSDNDLQFSSEKV